MEQQKSIFDLLLKRINEANFILIRHPHPLRQEEKQQAQPPTKG